jgi:putative protease
MSLGTHNASANRGVCRCRHKYRVTDEKRAGTGRDNQYHVPENLCTIQFLDQILNSASILKLEGRGRSADYVSSCLKCYHEAVKLAERQLRRAGRVDSVFNRGFWHGSYYLGEKLGEWCEDGDRAKR